MKALDAIDIAMGVERIEPNSNVIVNDISSFNKDEDYDLRLLGIDLLPFFNVAMVRRIRIHGVFEDEQYYQEDLSWHPDEGDKYLAFRKEPSSDIVKISRQELLERLKLWETAGFAPENLEKIVKHLAVTDQARQETLKEITELRTGKESKIPSLKSLEEPVRLLEATNQVIKFEGKEIQIPQSGSFSITVRGVRDGVHNTVTCSKIEPGATLLWRCAPEDDVVIQIIPVRSHVSNSLISAVAGLRKFFSSPDVEMPTSNPSTPARETIS